MFKAFAFETAVFKTELERVTLEPEMEAQTLVLIVRNVG